MTRAVGAVWHTGLLATFVAGDLGCGKIAEVGEGDAIGGAGGVGGSSMTGGAPTGGSPAGGSGGSPGGTTGTGGAACVQTQESIQFTLTDWEGCSEIGSDASGGVTTAVVGRVAAVTSRSMDIETCTGCDACTWTTRTLKIDSVSLPDLDAIFTTGAFVRLETSARYFHGCYAPLTVRNQPSLCGLANPVASDDRLYLAISDPGLGAANEPLASPAGPLTVAAIDLSCGGSHALDFTVGTTAVRVAMGHTVTMDVGNGVAWTIRNLRSFYTPGTSDDYLNWAYWIARLK